jgi:UDP-glucose 4-epimerase
LNVSAEKATFVEGDIRNEALMTEILHDHAIEAVIHFAGLKAVGESVAKPLEYYDNNVTGTLKLVSAMRAAGVKNFILAPPPPSTAISRKSLMSKASRPARRKARTAKAS